ncbi:alpha/beta fold hydrolase [Haloferula sp. BvORR071]|uniref:alpha/beta hydrolase family protein n=1 Tax=Haloferula sp. BvORR071 TaxID=1396141 RepID=UPI0005515A71|nr:alpha/beta fold hydrolase [Haloferula sp. BvORR071]
MKLSSLFLCVLIAGSTLFAADPAPYDPLKVPDDKIESQTFEVKDAKRERTLPIRVYLPASEKPAPVVIFSHGLGGSRDNNPYLGNHWAKRGYAVVFVQHPGSDESVWKDAPLAEKMGDLKKAASLENYMDRGKDIPVVIDALATWNDSEGHALKGRLDLDHLGMSGHSFGAQTTQAVAGQSLARGRFSFEEKRIDAAVMMSPSPPTMGDPATAFASIKIPCLLMTGTLDDSPIGNSKAEDRLKVFPAIVNAPAWQVVFDKATHMSFGERPLKGEATPDPRYHRAILALTTAFWDAELKGDSTAKAWLNGEGSKSVLKPEDKWEVNAKAKAP